MDQNHIIVGHDSHLLGGVPNPEGARITVRCKVTKKEFNILAFVPRVHGWKCPACGSVFEPKRTIRLSCRAMGL